MMKIEPGTIFYAYQDSTVNMEVEDSINSTQQSASIPQTDDSAILIDSTLNQSALLDTVEINQVNIIDSDTPPVSIKKEEIQIEPAQDKIHKREIIVLEKYEKETDTLVAGNTFHTQDNFNFYSVDSHSYSVKPTEFLIHATKDASGKFPINFKVHHYKRSELNWTLLIGLISILLLLFLKSFYRKFLSQVATTIVNFQLADKMLREKNIIVRRAFFLMNLNYILILSLFVLLLSIYWNFNINENHFIEYLILLGFVIGIVIIRHIIYYFLGYLFVLPQAITEQIHINYLVNKNVGLFLFPLVFISIYTSPQISKTFLFLGIGVVFLATLYKLIRGFQIIIRNGVLILYAILYFCTLELLPLVLGSKLIISLR